jgi:hypothetical protein
LPALSLETPLYRLIIFGLVVGVVILCVTFFVRVRERGVNSIWQTLSFNFAAESYDAIGGFLYLWLLTLSVIVLKILMGLIAVLPPFSRDIWAMANDPFASGYHPLLRPLLLFELVGRTALLCGVTVVAEYFFKKHRRAPRLIVGFMLTYLVFLIAGSLMKTEVMKPLGKFLLSGFQSPFLRKEFILALISCLTWVPYFLRSARVKATFVH